MRIACVAYMEGFGGAERQIVNLANQLSGRGHEVHLIAIVNRGITYEINPKVNFHSLNKVVAGTKFKQLCKRRKDLIKLLTELKCDVSIHFNFQSAYFLSSVCKKKIGKVIYSERGDPGDKEFSGVMGIIRFIANKGINGFVFQSDEARNYFKGEHVLNNSVVIPNACFLRKTKPNSQLREKRIINIGRLHEQKNQRLLIDAFANSVAVQNGYTLEIYGEGSLLEKLKQRAEDLKVKENVYFMGTSPNIIKKIANGSLFVLSSDFEGVPNALIEAMALGLPCISTDCRPGGARTLIKVGENGLITPTKDVKALSNAIDYMLTNRYEAERMALNACEIVYTLAPKRIYDRWETFIETIVKKN